MLRSHTAGGSLRKCPVSHVSFSSRPIRTRALHSQRSISPRRPIMENGHLWENPCSRRASLPSASFDILRIACRHLNVRVWILMDHHPTSRASAPARTPAPLPAELPSAGPPLSGGAQSSACAGATLRDYEVKSMPVRRSASSTFFE